MRSILVLLFFAASLSAHAILIRADREDAEYLELATRYPAAIALGPGIEGVLIAPRWVLTSASAAILLQGAKLRPPLEIGGERNAIAATFIHPGWKQGREADLALVLLRDAVTRIAPTPILRERDELDDVAYLVAHGQTGKLGQTARSNDGRKRAAINTIDRVTPAALAARIKPNDEASDLQGALAANETGAPLFIEIARRPYVAGIFSAAEGEWQLFARVSSYAQWIDDAMFKAAVEEAASVGKRP